MRSKVLFLTFVWLLGAIVVLPADQPPTPLPSLIYRCAGTCKGLWWDEYRHRPLRVQQYWRPDDRLSNQKLDVGCFLEAFDDAGNQTEVLGEWGGRLNQELDFFFVDGGNKLIIESSDGADKCLATTVWLHDLQWPSTRNELLLEPAEINCDGEPLGAEHPEVMHLPKVGRVIPSEDGVLLANSLGTGSLDSEKTQLVDLDAKKVVAETDGTLIGRAGPRSFYVVESVYTEHHRLRDRVLKEFSLDGVKVVRSAVGNEYVVRGSRGQLFLTMTVRYGVDTGQPHLDKPEKQVLENEYRLGVRPSAQGAQNPQFPCKILNAPMAWQEAAGGVVVSVEEDCNGKTGYALYRLPKS